MLLINTTLELVPDQFSSTLNNRIQCLVDIQLSLRIHYLVVLLIHVVFLYLNLVLILGFAFAFIISPYFRNFIGVISSHIRLSSNAPEERYFYVFLLFIKEMALTSVYVLFAYLYKWFGLANDDSPITSLNFRRWIVEGSFAPYLFSAIFLEYYMGCLNTVFDKYQFLYITAITLKVPVYFFMRCAESRPDFFLNRLESSLMIIFCESDSRRKIFSKLLQYIK